MNVLTLTSTERETVDQMANIAGGEYERFRMKMMTGNFHAWIADGTQQIKVMTEDVKEYNILFANL